VKRLYFWKTRDFMEKTQQIIELLKFLPGLLETYKKKKNFLYCQTSVPQGNQVGVRGL
jgi:hypothetical protein